MTNYKFEGKYIIKFDLRCLTGLHIGGTTEGLEIGGLDNPVIKDRISGLPYIPGSSLKGKLRCLLEWELDKIFTDKKGETPPHTCENDPEIIELKNKAEKAQNEKEKIKEDLKEKLKKKIAECPICRIFGLSASAEVGEPTRLTVRDAYPSKSTIENWKNILGEGLYTEMKTENAIDRITSMANPRTMERVPKDSVFEVEMIYDIYKSDDVNFLKCLFQAMYLLEDSFLGGSGSRGSGKIKFENPKITFRSKKDYYLKPKSNEKPIELSEVFKDWKGEQGKWKSDLIDEQGNLKPSIPKKIFDDFEKVQWTEEKEEKTM